MRDDEASLCVRLSRDGLHIAAAVCGSVAGIYVEVLGMKTERTVISGALTEREYLFSAKLTDKAAVIFGKSFAFRCHHSPFRAFSNARKKAYGGGGKSQNEAQPRKICDTVCAAFFVFLCH